MAHQDRGPAVVVVLLDEVAELGVQRQIRRERDDAGELVLGRETRKEGNGATLREAAEHDAAGGDFMVLDLRLDQSVEILSALQDAPLILLFSDVVYLPAQSRLRIN